MTGSPTTAERLASPCAGCRVPNIVGRFIILCYPMILDLSSHTGRVFDERFTGTSKSGRVKGRLSLCDRISYALRPMPCAKG